MRIISVFIVRGIAIVGDYEGGSDRGRIGGGVCGADTTWCPDHRQDSCQSVPRQGYVWAYSHVRPAQPRPHCCREGLNASLLVLGPGSLPARALIHVKHGRAIDLGVNHSCRVGRAAHASILGQWSLVHPPADRASRYGGRATTARRRDIPQQGLLSSHIFPISVTLCHSLPSSFHDFPSFFFSNILYPPLHPLLSFFI